MHGLYLLWWVQEKHVPAAFVAAILAAGDLALMALEVPTGWFADRCGHRVSLIAGSLIQVAGMLFCWLGAGVSGLLTASLLVALGDAFRSGADQALLYRSCVALDRESDFQKIQAKTNALQLGALVGLILAGGAIVETWGFAIGWLVETMVSAAGLAIAYAMVEPPARAETTSSNSAAVAQQPDATLLPPRLSAGDLRNLMRLIVPASLLCGAASAAAFLAQTVGGADAGRVTALVAIVTLAEAAGSAVAVHLAPRMRTQVMLASGAAVIMAAGLIFPAAFLPAVVALSFLLGVAHPLRAAAVQHLTADGMRARAASIASACDNAFRTVALISAGLLPRR